MAREGGAAGISSPRYVGGGHAGFTDMLEHGGSVIPEHRRELRGGAREFVVGAQFGTDLAAFAAHGMALDALGLEDSPTVLRTAAEIAVFLNRGGRAAVDIGHQIVHLDAGELGPGAEFLRDRLNHVPVSYTHLRAHETGRNLVCRLLL